MAVARSSSSSVTKGQFWGKHLPDKFNTPNNGELDWSVQRHTTGADAWLQALDESIIGCEVGGANGAISQRGRSLISAIALFVIEIMRL